MRQRVITIVAAAVVMLSAMEATGKTPSMTCKATGRIIQCAAKDYGNLSMKWAAYYIHAPSFFAYGKDFVFKIEDSEDCIIELRLTDTENEILLHCRAWWDRKAGKAFFRDYGDNSSNEQ